jgi:hypothetical protein
MDLPDSGLAGAAYILRLRFQGGAGYLLETRFNAL